MIKEEVHICRYIPEFNMIIIHLQYRIANALFGMTLGGAAQHMQTEGVRARDQQEKALKHFEGTNAIRTWLQLVGTLHFAYLPTLITMLYETMANQVK